MSTLKLKELRQRSRVNANDALSEAYAQIERLVHILSYRKLSSEAVEMVNNELEEINRLAVSGDELKEYVKNKQMKIVKLIAKELCTY